MKRSFKRMMNGQNSAIRVWWDFDRRSVRLACGALAGAFVAFNDAHLRLPVMTRNVTDGTFAQNRTDGVSLRRIRWQPGRHADPRNVLLSATTCRPSIKFLISCFHLNWIEFPRIFGDCNLFFPEDVDHLILGSFDSFREQALASMGTRDVNQIVAIRLSDEFVVRIVTNKLVFERICPFCSVWSRDVQVSSELDQ